MKGFGILLNGESNGERHIENGFKFLDYIFRRKMAMLINIGIQEEETI